MPPTGRPAERRLAAVERALRVLDAFMQVPGDARNTDLVRITGINASTVSRTLSTLVDAGYVAASAGLRPLPARHAPAGALQPRAGRARSARASRAASGRAGRGRPARRSRSRFRASATPSPSTSCPAGPRWPVSPGWAGRASPTPRPPARWGWRSARRRVPPAALERFTDRTVTDPAALDAELAARADPGLGARRG